MIAFISGKRRQGYQIFTMADDGTDIRCLTNAFPPRKSLFLDPIWSPDGKSLAFTYKENILSPYSQVATIRVDSKAVHYLTPDNGMYAALQWLSNDWIVYKETIMRPSEAHNYVGTMRGDGSHPRRLLNYANYQGGAYLPDSYHTVRVSPDGVKIAMISWHDHQLYISRQGSDPVALPNDGMKIHRARWSPDSSKIAFAATRARSLVYERLYTLHHDGSNLQQVGRILAESEFAWSPDNQQIATINSHQGRLRIDAVHTQTLMFKTLAAIEENPQSGDPPTCPAWSPDGRNIIYTTFAGLYAHLYRADVKTGQSELIMGDEGAFHHVSYTSWY